MRIDQEVGRNSFNGIRNSSNKKFKHVFQFKFHVYCIHIDISKTYVYYLFNLSCAQLVECEKVT